MIYYNEQGELLQESDIDLEHGYLTDDEVIHHPAIPATTHIAEEILPNGVKYTYKVTDKRAVPAYDEVVSHIYHPTGATPAEKLEGQVVYTAVMTDTLLAVDI